LPAAAVADPALSPIPAAAALALPPEPFSPPVEKLRKLLKSCFVGVAPNALPPLTELSAGAGAGTGVAARPAEVLVFMLGGM
jgi:hypothetical protein